MILLKSLNLEIQHRCLSRYSSSLPPLGLPYIIHVTTGDVEQAGTSARVFVTLHGGKDGNQTSGKIWLESGKFVRGRTDVFNVNVAEKLSPLSRIDIGHDNSGMGAGWNLDKVWKQSLLVESLSK